MYRFSIGRDTLSESFFKSASHTDVQCALHVHYSMEVVFVSGGELVMNVNGADRVIRSGEATLILPFEPHSFFTPYHSKCLVTEFSPELTKEFYSAVKGKLLLAEVFPLSGEFISLLEKLSGMEEPNALSVKAALYPLCLNILETVSFKEGGKTLDHTFIEAIKYIYEHYTDDELDLNGLSKAIGIHPVYLSRMFSCNAGMGFLKYLSLLRTGKAADRLLSEPETTISEIALGCGFGSIRTFNRLFYDLFGSTPTEYREINKSHGS
ncbi:MAG: AraC family transcriptional regulator [Acutalibacteraceae bacterium]|nr:AraC family transcriptional regulator [Acutalibacteraceae bacterium]